MKPLAFLGGIVSEAQHDSFLWKQKCTTCPVPEFIIQVTNSFQPTSNYFGYLKLNKVIGGENSISIPVFSYHHCNHQRQIIHHSTAQSKIDKLLYLRPFEIQSPQLHHLKTRWKIIYVCWLSFILLTVGLNKNWWCWWIFRIKHQDCFLLW